MSMRRLASALALALLAENSPAWSAKSDSCDHCHGSDGNSSSGQYPHPAEHAKA
jgi:cytochrome c553